MSQEILPARISRWLFTTNHKEIGILYIITSLFFFLAAGLLALTMRTQLSVPDNNLLSPDLYNQFVTVHGLLMIFWVLSPFAFGFANYIIPLQIGARDLAFPRLNAMSYWFYLVSGAAMIMSFAFGGAPDLGWTLYSPQTSFQFTPTIGLNVGAAGLILIVLFPAIGLIADAISTYTRRPLYGSKYIIGSMVAAAIISFIVWGHHMFVTGIGITSTKLYTVTTIAVSLPFDVMVIAMVESLVKARVRLKAAALFSLGAVALFVIGGITGVYLASVALDHALRGTYFVVAHFHYIMVGASIMGLIAGLYYWFPKMTGRMYHEGLAKIHFILSFIGFNILYFPMFLLLDMPRRIATYAPNTGLATLNLMSTAGGFIFGLAQILLFVNLFASLLRGAISGPNPWEAWTLEWSLPSPPPAHDFDTIPTIAEDGTYHFGNSPGYPNGSGDPNGSKIGHGIAYSHLEGQSPWPIVVAFAAFIFFLGITIGQPSNPSVPVTFQPFWPLVLDGAILGVIALYGYSKERFSVHEETNVESWPFREVPNVKLGIWTFLGAEVIFFGVLIGAYFFVRTNSATWPAVGSLFEVRSGFAMTLVLLTSSLTAIMALVSAKIGSRNGLMASLLATFGLGVSFLYIKANEWIFLGTHGVFSVANGLPATSYFITTGVHGVHVFAGMLMTLYLLVNTVKGRYLKGDYHAIEHFGLYWHFVDIVWVFLFPLFYLI